MAASNDKRIYMTFHDTRVKEMLNFLAEDSGYKEFKANKLGRDVHVATVANLL